MHYNYTCEILKVVKGMIMVVISHDSGSNNWYYHVIVMASYMHILWTEKSTDDTHDMTYPFSLLLLFSFILGVKVLDEIFITVFLIHL